MTSIRFFDDHGLDISTSFVQVGESASSCGKNFAAPGTRNRVIFEHPRLVDFYAESFLKALAVEQIRARRMRVVVDYAHSAAVVVLPRLLNELGCDVVTLNAHTEGFTRRSSPRDRTGTSPSRDDRRLPGSRHRRLAQPE